eukprot:465695-Amphidinium_carterae.1
MRDEPDWVIHECPPPPQMFYVRVYEHFRQSPTAWICKSCQRLQSPKFKSWRSGVRRILSE